MRRVGTVRLAARSDALVRRGALLLEDALRTASFPEAGPGRVLLIRSLPVGVIRGHLPPSSLALSLERLVRELTMSAVHAGDASAGHRLAVFFRDDAEPSVTLAGRLARGEPVSAWFWPLAVPDFHPNLPRDEALRLVLATALRTSAGPAAAIRLVEDLHEEGGLDVLLESLRWQEGPALVQAFGGSLPAPALPVETVSPGTPETVLRAAPLRAAVARWVETWGAEDARSVWLAAMALVLERRGRLVDVRLFERAARLAATMVSAPAAPEGSRPFSSTSSGAPGAVRNTEDSASVMNVPRHEPTSTSASAPSSPEPPPGIAAPGRTGAPAPAGGVRAPHPASQRADTQKPPPIEHGPGEMPSPGTDAKPLLEWPEVPRPTAVGGLLFLLPVLERLGMAALLAEHPGLLELDVPDRLLSLIAERVGAPVSDPSRVILDSRVRGPRPAHCSFALPERLRTLVADMDAPLTFREEGPTGRTVLTDASRRLPLAVTYGMTPESRAPLASGTLPTTLHGEDDLGLLLRGLLTALRRWCRRHARMGLHDLVRRPGRIVATRTHVNVLFDIRQADIRVRGAGLDVDPGWVPWLGRVVRFHYLYGEE
ncbi:hypothetical protein ACN28E_21145 [Archangium lansingense]|uniref:hypothetical protein n=1 Tax=Archangium lansingense TaxID=2995310 RepID=UPI003B807844